MERKRERISERALICRRKSSDFDSAIPWFESRRLSQPVPSLSGISVTQNSARCFRELAGRCEVSEAEVLELGDRHGLRKLHHFTGHDPVPVLELEFQAEAVAIERNSLIHVIDDQVRVLNFSTGKFPLRLKH